MWLANLTISQVVEKDSACLGLPNEVAVGIGGADHSDVCKFDDPLGQKYSPVKNAMAEVVEHGIQRRAARRSKFSRLMHGFRSIA